MEIEKTMGLITSVWPDPQTGERFKVLMAVPYSENAPYRQAILLSNTLVVVTKTQSEKYQFIPKYNDNGQPISKGGAPVQQRVKVLTPDDFSIIEKDEIIDFIHTHCHNASNFTLEDYFHEAPTMLEQHVEQAEAQG